MCTKRNTYIYVWASTIVNVRHVESACLFSVYLLPVGTYMVCKCVRSYLWVWNIHSFIYLRRSCVSSVHHGWQIDFAKHCMQWPFIIEKICRQFLCIKCQSVRLIKRPVVLTQAHVDLRMNWLWRSFTKQPHEPEFHDTSVEQKIWCPCVTLTDSVYSLSNKIFATNCFAWRNEFQLHFCSSFNTVIKWTNFL